MATPNTFADKTGSVLLSDLDENFEYVDTSLTTLNSSLTTNVSTLQTNINAVQTNLDNINTELVNDLTPQLGGDLDFNSNNIIGNGNIGIGTTSPEANLHLKSTGSVSILLEADTDNVTESDNPTIYFRQDSNLVNGQLGLRESGNHFEIKSSTGVMLAPGNTDAAFANTNGDFWFNSGYGSIRPVYGVRAWVNFRGTGTVTIRGDGNVSSITDNGVGKYRVNFSTAMPDTNYAVVSVCGAANTTSSWNDANASSSNGCKSTSTSYCEIVGQDNSTDGYYDWGWVNCLVVR